jgi:hypothetical protein
MGPQKSALFRRLGGRLDPPLDSHSRGDVVAIFIRYQKNPGILPHVLCPKKRNRTQNLVFEGEDTIQYCKYKKKFKNKILFICYVFAAFSS